jgi:hypothetical protein
VPEPSSRRYAAIGATLLLALAALVWFVRRGGEPAAEPEDAGTKLEPTQVPAPTGPTAPEPPLDRLPSPALEEEFEALAAAAAQLAAMPEEFHNGVMCNLAEPTEPFQGVFVMMWGDMIYGSYPAFTQGTTVSLDVARARGQGYLHLPGRQPVWVEFRDHYRWPEGTEESIEKLRAQGMPISDAEPSCNPDPIELVEGEAIVRGMVRNAAGEPEGRIWVAGCGGHTLTEEDGSYELSVLPDPCAVRAFRIDGLFTARGTEEPVEPVAGEEQVVDLAVPDFPTAGMGVAFRLGNGGMRVLRAVEGGDAAEQGIQAGDLIVSIDGEPTAEMSLDDFVDAALGHEGSDVVLGVESGGEVEQVTITRRTLE